MFATPKHGWGTVKEVGRSYLNVTFFFTLFIFNSWLSGPVMWKSKAVPSTLREANEKV